MVLSSFAEERSCYKMIATTADLRFFNYKTLSKVREINLKNSIV
jgi:hypothetical protein